MIEKHTDGAKNLASVSGLILVMLLATILRFMRIGDQSLWYDEGNTVRMTHRGAGDILEAAADDIHPPGYYLAVTGWVELVGRTEFALRGFSALAGVVLVAVVIKIAGFLWGPITGAIGGVVASIHPALVYYSQEARMYMLAAMLGAGLVAVAGKMVRDYEHWGKTKFWYLYVLVGAAGLYTHYTFAFVLVATNFWVLWRIWIEKKMQILGAVVNWYIVQTGVLILYLPWLPIAIEHLTTWPAEREETRFVSRAGDTWNWLSVGPTLDMGDGNVAATVLIGVLVMLGVIRGGGRLIAAWALVSAGINSTVGLLGESFSKFLVLSVPGITILTASGVGRIIRFKGKWAGIAAVLMLSPVLWFYARGLSNLYSNPQYFRDDYRGIAKDLLEWRKLGDAILLNAPNQIEVFSYYYPETAHVYPMAQSRPMVLENEQDRLRKIAAKYDRLAVIYWGENQSDPDSVVEGWLNENTYKTGSDWYGDVRVARYAVPDASDIPLVFSGEEYSGGVELLEYAVGQDYYRAGDVIQVVLVWVANNDVEEDLIVFVHLYTEMERPPVAQHDGYPGGGHNGTIGWSAGTKVLDRHGIQLPENIAPGEYIVATGLYRASDGARLVLKSDDGHADRLILHTISVVE